MSELGRGSWDEAREAIASLQAGDRDPRRPWMIATDLCDSGHIELDWPQGQWCVAVPALLLLPRTALCAVWTGARPRRWQSRLVAELAGATSVFDFVVDQGQGPSARFIKAGSVEDLADIARRLGLRFAIDPATPLAERLPAIGAPSRPAPRPVSDERLEWLDVGPLRWRTIDEGPGSRRGLFRVERGGRRVGRWRDGSDAWWDVDLADGMALATREAPEPVVEWAPPSRDRSVPSMLSVRRPLMLPALARRLAVASSGLLPIRDGNWARYRNVSRDNARRVFAALGHPIVVRNPPEGASVARSG